MGLVNGRNEQTERNLLPGDSRKMFGGRESPTAQMWNGSTGWVLPLQGREALRESCALGAGELLQGSGLGKRPAQAREQPDLCTMVAWAGRDGVHLLWEGFRSEFC